MHRLAKVVVATAPGEVTASIVCEHVDDVEQLTDRLAQWTDDADLVVADSTVWLLVRHRLSSLAALAGMA